MFLLLCVALFFVAVKIVEQVVLGVENGDGFWQRELAAVSVLFKVT
ncbi:hypothetical protein SH668x_003529 [Planctomicrobium sp. SH668]